MIDAGNYDFSGVVFVYDLLECKLWAESCNSFLYKLPLEFVCVQTRSHYVMS